MPRKAFHKGRITIFAGVGTPRIRVYGIFTNGQIWFCEDAFHVYLIDDWSGHFFSPFGKISAPTVLSGHPALPRQAAGEKPCHGIYSFQMLSAGFCWRNNMMLYHFSWHLIHKDLMYNQRKIRRQLQWQKNNGNTTWNTCLLYTSDAADD